MSLMAGPVVSTTVTTKPAEPVLPAASVIEQVTVVVPSAKTDAEEGGQVGRAGAVDGVGGRGGEASRRRRRRSVASAVMSAGTVTAGAVVSSTVTMNDPVPVLPAASVAEQLTVVVPRANTPAGGVQVTSTLPSTRSVAVAVKLTVAPGRAGGLGGDVRRQRSAAARSCPPR